MVILYYVTAGFNLKGDSALYRVGQVVVDMVCVDFV